ncbi:hypothetical protein MKW92_015352 [Papaver armeniacum]|nr:hypothetical protein MKW92_015352 [Papaver armeniacum]
MASSASSSMLPKTNQVKRLSELLEEEQEPFVLHEYLSERGYSKRSQNCEGGYCSYNSKGGNSSKDLKRLSEYELSNRRKKKNKHHPSKVLRSVLNKLLTSVYHHHDSRKSAPVTVSSYNTRSNVDLDNRFSSASSMTLFESSSEADTEELSAELLYQVNSVSSLTSSADNYKHKLTQQAQNEIPARRVNQWGCMEETKQHSPVSVLEELLFDEVQPSPRTSHKKKIKSNFIRQERSVITDESIFSASLWESLVHTLTEKQGSSSSSSNCLKTKRVLEQTKQLLFDCVRETVENYSNQGGKIVSTSDSVRVHCGHERVLLGSEDIGKIISEKICLWGKQAGNLTNITQLVKSDLSKRGEEEEYWKETPQAQIRECIGIEISDEILEDIQNEIVFELIQNFEPSK